MAAPTSTGTAVFVTGIREPDAYTGDYATVAYDAATGSQLWVSGNAGAAQDDEGNFFRPALAVSPDGATLYFAGSSGGYQTLAYNATAGTTLWARNNPAKATDVASAIAVSPRGTAVFVTGTDTGTTAGDYGTIAYRSCRLPASAPTGPLRAGRSAAGSVRQLATTVPSA
jgi:outer membrane protein assembly factor BamB